MATSDTMQSVTKDVREMGGRVAERARDQYDRIKEGVSDLAEEGRARFEEMEQSLEDYVAVNPLKSIFVSVGVGLLIGRYLLR